jgi:protein-tyrosine phosphatase
LQENIIAMGFPSGDVSDFADDSTSAMAKSKLSKVEALYRNPISEVRRFLDSKHPGTYKVYNLCSERLYDPENFHFMVAHFAFEDHNCPPLVMVKSFCLSAAQHLANSPKHVVAVHCKAGKSRTGLMVCALMMHLRLFASTEQCIRFYNAARCHDQKGLTLASQRRYVRYYFHEMLHGPAPENLRFLTTICVSNCPTNLSLFWRFRTHLPRDPYTSTRDLERKDECICNVRLPRCHSCVA